MFEELIKDQCEKLQDPNLLIDLKTTSVKPEILIQQTAEAVLSAVREMVSGQMGMNGGLKDKDKTLEYILSELQTNQDTL